MMYQNRMVACIKVDGKVLRECGDNKDTVYVPFGAEYAVFLENLETRRAVVDVIIDGKSATGNTELVVMPGQKINLERFISNGNLREGNRFKFIERTASVEQHRGVGSSDGLVQIVYRFEQLPRQILSYVGSPQVVQSPWNTGSSPGPSWGTTTISGSIAAGGNVSMSAASVPQNSANVYSANTVLRSRSASTETLTSAAAATPYSGEMMRESLNDVGVTAPGSVSDQQFQHAAWFPTEAPQPVMIFRLLGGVGMAKVKTPVTVKTKLKCVSCGKVNASSAKFCTECSTGLVLV